MDRQNLTLLTDFYELTMMQGYYLANETSPMGEQKKWPLGGCGFLHGLDNNYASNDIGNRRRLQRP